MIRSLSPSKRPHLHQDDPPKRGGSFDGPALDVMGDVLGVQRGHSVKVFEAGEVDPGRGPFSA